MLKLTEHFTAAELRAFTARSDLRAWTAVVVNWAIIAFAFALVALWPSPLTILLSLILIGGRHLGLGALMHECGHSTLFKSSGLNQWIGTWLCAGPVFYRLDDYMSNHLNHHRNAGSLDDPDKSRYQHYPVASKSLRRKIIRDLTGRTTFNFLRATLTSHRVIAIDDQGRKRFDVIRLLQVFHATLISNLLLLLVLALFGVAELYLLWVAAYFSFYMFFSRIRNLAEHAAVPELFNPDPLLHTRTTLACWWEKLTFAPNNVNYHLEHHLFPAVPAYRLPAFHQALQSKGLLDYADIETGYPSLMKRLVAV